MTTQYKISIVIAIAGVIANFFAAPIVFAASPALAVLLVAIGVLYTLGIIATIWAAYRDPDLLDE